MKLKHRLILASVLFMLVPLASGQNIFNSPYYQKGELSTSALDSPEPVLGRGYNSLKERYVSIGIEGEVGVPLTGKSKDIISVSQMFSQQELEEFLKIEVSASGGFGGFGAKLSSDFEKSTSVNEYSTVVAFKRILVRETQQLIPGSLTINARNAYDSDLGLFHNNYGDSYVGEVTIGGGYFFTMKIHFRNRTDKEKFEGSLSVSWTDAFNGDVDVTQSIRQTNINAMVNLFVLRAGGAPSDDWFNSNGYSLVCSLATFEKCQETIQALTKYASTQFADQLSKDGVSIIGAKNVSYDTAGLNLNIPQLLVPPDVVVARNIIDRNMSLQYGFKKHLDAFSVNFGDMLSFGDWTTLTNAIADASQNITHLQQAEIACYDQISNCKSETDLRLAAMIPIDVDSLLAGMQIQNLPPTAAFWGPVSAKVGQSVDFIGSASSDPDGHALSYYWNFSDGSTTTLENPRHVFYKPGSYQVCLTVTDSIEADKTCRLIQIDAVVEPWVSAPQYSKLPHFTNNALGYGAQDNGVRLVDLNGDGLLDMIQRAWWWSSNVQKGAWINTGAGWQSVPEYTPPAHITNNAIGRGAQDNGVRLVDLNGDGLLDMIQKVWWWSGNVQKGAWINTGTGWQIAPEYTPPAHITNNAAGKGAQDNGVRLIDLNGDGLLDMIQNVWWNSSNVQKGAWINTGSGWQSAPQYIPPAHITNNAVGFGAQDNGVRLVDLNGDGLLDMIQKAWWWSTNVQSGAWINNGKGWQSAPEYTPPAHITNNAVGRGAQDNGVRLVDLNGDGLLDMIQKVWWWSSNVQSGAWINTGTGWQIAPEYTPPAHITNNAAGKGAQDNGVRLIDLNGDGLLDMVQRVWWSWSNIQKGAWINTGSGWKSVPEYTPPQHIANNASGHGALDNGVRFVDLNGDGRKDMLGKVWWNSSNIQVGAWMFDAN